MHPIFERLKERKLVQWGVAYLAGAWLLLQVLSTLGPTWDLDLWVYRAAQIGIGVGFFVTVTLAWYHGERGHQRIAISEAVLLSGIVLLGGGALLKSLPGSAPAERPRPEYESPVRYESIAVLPFSDLSADGEFQHVAEDVSEQTLIALAQVPGLRVPGAASSFRFRDRAADARLVGDTLGVDAVLDGSVRVRDGQLAVTVSLLDASDGTAVWTHVVEEGFNDLWAAQEEVARQVVRELGLAYDGSRPLVAGGTKSPEALRAYLEFRSKPRTDPLTRREGIELLREAVAHDSTFVVALIQLASAYSNAPNQFFMSEAEAYPLAEAALAQATRVAPRDYAVLQYTAGHLRRSARPHRAIAAYETLLTINPNDASARASLAHLLQSVGRLDDARRSAELAVELDPLSRYAHQRLTEVLVSQGQYERALVEADRTLALGRSFPARAAQVTAMVALGRADQGVVLARALVAEMPSDGDALGLLAYAHAQAGDATQAVEITRRLEGGEGLPVLATAAAVGHAAVGDIDTAFDWLDRARLDEPGVLAANMRNHPWPQFDNLRGDPRFNALLEQLGMSSAGGS